MFVDVVYAAAKENMQLVLVITYWLLRNWQH